MGGEKQWEGMRKLERLVNGGREERERKKGEEEGKEERREGVREEGHRCLV